jgi:hypothetical protein
MAAKKFGTGKPAPQVRNDVSPYAAQFAASDAGKSRHPQFEVGTHDCTFLGIEMPDAPPGKDPWAIAHFQLEDSSECVALNCMNSRSLNTSLERLKSLMIAVVGCPSREDYDAFDPEGVFFSAMLGYENERAADAAPYLDGTRKVRVIVTRGKDLEDGSDFFRNVSYEMHPDVAAENAA